MTSMRPAIVICVPRTSPLWMTRVGASSPTSLNGTHVRPLIDTPPTNQTDIDHTDNPRRSAPPLTRIHAMNPARILAPGFLAQGRQTSSGFTPADSASRAVAPSDAR